MSIPAEANGHSPEAAKTSPGAPGALPNEAKTETLDPATNGTPPKPQAKQQPSRNRKPKRPNYAQLHSKPLPLTVHPLPAFHPSNPISLLRLTYVYLTHLLAPPSSHASRREDLYTGLFSPRTRSIHVTDPEHVRALWEMGFFGKGTLSRSEPTWMQRGGTAFGGRGEGGAEAATRKRREERRLFKLERARVEREAVERQRAREEGKAVEGDGGAEEIADVEAKHQSLEEGRIPDADAVQTPNGTTQARPPDKPTTSASSKSQTDIRPTDSPIKDPPPSSPSENQEHLQLTLEEAFFLSYSLGILTIHPPPPALNPAPFHPGPQPYSNADLLFLSCHYSAFPPVDSGAGIAPDDQFLLNYTVYHHFRSLGWVVRPGVKFGVDYLLYNRGPVFSHAEFAVLIIPSYTHRYWNTPGGRSRRRVHYPGEASGFSTLEEDGGSNPISADGGGGGKDWWFLHCVNRVQSQVKKSLVLCYVDVPCPWEVGLDDEWDAEVDVGRLLRGYRVREFVVRRWVLNRSRD